MARKRATPVTGPTIADVLTQFLADQRGRLAARTFAHYAPVIELLRHSLNNYAWQTLDKPNAELFDRLYKAQGAEHREFCEIFGPAYILPSVGEFLDYFMIRKVMAGKEMLRAAGTVTKNLAAWLAEKGYVTVEAAGRAAERGGRAARELPKAHELASLLSEFAEDQERGDGDGEIDDHFTLTRVEPGKLWVAGMSGREIGPIDVPEEISRRCTVGWTVSGRVGRFGKTWRLVEAWNVYPR